MADNFDLEKTLIEFNQDQQFIELRERYSTRSFLEIMSVERSENRHSSFLAWLLEAKDFAVNVKDHPIVNYEKQEIVKDSKKNTTNKTKVTSDKLNKNNKDYKITLGNKTVMLHLKPNEIRTFKRKYVRMIESWSVMGHVRHYRNGKTVFIKPYVKGKARNNQDEIIKRNYVVKRNKK